MCIINIFYIKINESKLAIYETIYCLHDIWKNASLPSYSVKYIKQKLTPLY